MAHVLSDAGQRAVSSPADWVAGPPPRDRGPGREAKVPHHDVQVDGRVLVAGGVDGTQLLASVELFDPATGNPTSADGPINSLVTPFGDTDVGKGWLFSTK